MLDLVVLQILLTWASRSRQNVLQFKLGDLQGLSGFRGKTSRNFSFGGASRFDEIFKAKRLAILVLESLQGLLRFSRRNVLQF